MFLDDTQVIEAPETPEIEVPSETEELSEQVVEQIAPQPTKKEKAPAESFREMRDKLARLERERDEALRKAQEYEARVQQGDEDDIRLGDDDIAEGKHLGKLNKKIKAMQEELMQYKRQSAMTSTEVRLKSQYPDFDKVVSVENIETLKEQYPEIADTLKAGSDLYATGVAAYTMIKKLGIHAELDPVQIAQKKAVQSNSTKPRPIASLSPQQGDSPLSHANAFANGLTDELKNQLRKEMEQYRRAF